MNWVKVDVRFPDHTKTLEVGPLAECLWLRGLCYAGRQLSDGFIPFAYVRRMGDLDGHEEAARLVEAGLWEDADGGWRIHDYLEWQRSKADAEAISLKRAEAGRAGGKQRASNLLHSKQNASKPQANAKQTRSKTQADKRREEEIREERTPHTPLAGGDAAEGIKPWDLFEACCDELGAPTDALSERDRGIQLRAAKQLTEAGAAPDDVRRLIRYLQRQGWVNGGIDMRLLAGQHGKWVMNGRPESPPKGERSWSKSAPSSGVVSRADGDRQRQLIGR